MVNPEKQSALSDNMTSFHSQADLSAKTFGVGMKERLADRDMAWLSRKTGISTSTLSDIGRGKTPRTEIGRAHV